MGKLNNYQVDRKTEVRVHNSTLLEQIYCKAVHLLNPAVGLIGKAGELCGNVEVKIDLIIYDVSIKSDLGK